MKEKSVKEQWQDLAVTAIILAGMILVALLGTFLKHEPEPAPVPTDEPVPIVEITPVPLPYIPDIPPGHPLPPPDPAPLPVPSPGPISPEPDPNPPTQGPPPVVDEDPEFCRTGGGWYTIQRDDSLWRIAEKYYGNGLLWRDLYSINFSPPDPTWLIHAGNRIYVPYRELPCEWLER